MTLATLRDLQPSGIVNHPGIGFPNFIENLFIRISFEPVIKESIGWIGTTYRTGRKRSWTFRLRGFKGIYCLTFQGFEEEASGWHHGAFDLQYFPESDEAILDAFSIRENLLRTDPSFDKLVRLVPEDGDPLASQFMVGNIIFSCDAGEKNLFLSLWAPVRWREVRQASLHVKLHDGSQVEAVPPGGTDRNVPSFTLAWPFFDRLVLTFAYLMKNPPLCVILKRRNWPVWIITGENDCVPSEKNFTLQNFLSVGFGPRSKKKTADPRVKWAMTFFPGETGSSPSPETRIVWSVTPSQPLPRRGNSLWWKAPFWKEKNRITGFQTLGIHFRPPLLVITGFLGSGKTTLLNQIVEYKSLSSYKFIAVIQNEVGHVDVDSKLIDSAYRVTSLEEGCVCCTLMGEFHQAIRKICIEYEPDLIIVETTGVADPRSIIAEIPDLETFVRFDSIVCVVDVPNLEYILRDYPVARYQIECANLILLNKKDLMDEETLAKVEKIIGSINPHATIICTTYARVNPGLFFAMEEDIGVRVLREDHTSLECTDLDAQQVHTFTLRLPGDLKESSFMQFLDGLPDSVYRLKGVIKIKGRKQPQLLQYVVHRYEISNFPEKSMEPNTLVFIGRNLDENNLKQNFARCLAGE